MKLRKFRIDGYKALAGATFVVPRNLLMLLGTNGSGKSSTLQALALAREFANGDAEAFFDDRNWTTQDVKTQVGRSAHVVRCDMLFDLENGAGLVLWQFTWGLNTRNNRREMVWHLARGATVPTPVISYNGKKLEAANIDISAQGVQLKGSVLSLISAKRGGEGHSADLLLDLRDWLFGITSLELLSPSAMRGQAKGQRQDIGPRGQHLAKFLGNLPADAKANIVGRLAEFYLPLEGISTVRKRAGWVDVKVTEAFEGFRDIGLQHVSDGFLRLLALCAIPEFPSEDRLILLDELEDGIDPHILPNLIRRITEESGAQFIITSHSPILANFVQPEEIYFIGRIGDGGVIAAPFQEFETVKEGLEYFGSGELWTMMGREQLAEALSSHRQEFKGIDSPTRFQRESVSEFMHLSLAT